MGSVIQGKMYAKSLFGTEKHRIVSVKADFYFSHYALQNKKARRCVIGIGKDFPFVDRFYLYKIPSGYSRRQAVGKGKIDDVPFGSGFILLPVRKEAYIGALPAEGHPEQIQFFNR
jgi:hypothetical protein